MVLAICLGNFACLAIYAIHTFKKIEKSVYIKKMATSNFATKMHQPWNMEKLPANFKTELGVNGFLFVAVLFTIIVGVFMFYAAKIILKVVNSELKNQVRETLHDALQHNAFQGKKMPSDPISKQVIYGLKQVYKQPNALVVQNNQYLLIISVIVAVLLLTFTGILLFNNRKELPALPVMGENAVMFFFVCIIEFLFFFFIASKYIPTPPSFMATSTLAGLQKYL